MGNVQNVVGEIKLSIFEANMVLNNSLIDPNIRYNLVGIVNDSKFIKNENDTDKSTPMNHDLDVNLRGNLEIVNSELSILRKDYGADILIFYSGIYKGQKNTHGLAGASPDINTKDDAASIIRIDKANKRYNTAHELSHILKCNHQDKKEDDDGANFAFRKFSWAKFKTYRTTTHRGSLPKIPYHSNPNIVFEEIEIGDDEDANNSEMIESSGCEVSSYEEIGDKFTISLSHDIISCGCREEYPVGLNIKFKPIGSSSLPITYELFGSNNGQNFDLIATIVNSLWTTIYPPCDPNRTSVYHLYVKATDNNGKIAISPVTQHINIPKYHPFCWFSKAQSEIEERNEELDFISKNPIQNNLSITLKDHSNLKIFLFDNQGNTIYDESIKSSQIIIDFSGKPSGIYFLHLVNMKKGTYKIKKIIKI